VFVIGSQFCMNALAANFYPTPIRSTGVGWALGIGRIGSVLGPVVGGFFIGLGWSTPSIFFATAVPAVIAAVCVLLLGLADEPQPATIAPQAVAH
jgi:AAHS family 4-hydroxybenzoate transporter-like MFS transporter